MKMEGKPGSNDSSASSPMVISFIFRPEMMGHLYGYHESIGKAAAFNGWRHTVAIPVSWRKVKHKLPDNWHVCLEAKNIASNTSRLGFLVGALQLGSSMTRFLRKEIDPRVPIMLFVENFTFWEIPALLFSLFFIPRRNIFVWLLFRYGLDFDSTGQKSLRMIVFPLMDFLLPRGHLQLLTDSELLKRKISDVFKREVAVMPVPHTQDIDRSTRKTAKVKRGNVIRCWLPGEPRKDKGVEVVRKIASVRSATAMKVCLILGESAKLEEMKGGARVELLRDNVDRPTYLKLLRTSNIVLLPYNAERYSESTSGIFIEAVIAGSIPLVTAGTWMAVELARFGLQRLAVDWNSQNIIQTILEVSRDKKIAESLRTMSHEYERFHSIETYAQKMKGVFEGRAHQDKGHKLDGL